MPRSLAAARRAFSGWHSDVEGPPRWKRQALYDQGLLPASLDRGPLGSSALPHIRVAVIGAGLSGALAAWYLSSIGVQVTCFEATNRVGGRVSTDRNLVAGKVAEAGGELIGANQPMWFELAGMFGLSLVEVTPADAYETQSLSVRARLGDHELTEAEKNDVDRELGPVLDAISRDAFAVDPSAPWAAPSATDLDATPVAEAIDRHFGRRSSLARSLLEFVLENDLGTPPVRQSYLGLLSLVSAGRMGNDPAGLRGFWDATDTHRCAGGNDQLAAQLSGQLGDLRLSSPVERVIATPAGVAVDWSGSAPGRDTFDYAILAAPPTSWPHTEGTEPWDIRRYGMAQGPAITFLGAYEHDFWLNGDLAPAALWTAVGAVSESTDRQGGTERDFGLTVYAGGSYVSPGPNCAARLAGLYRGSRPTATRYVDWPHVPYIRTGISFPAPGQVTTIAPALTGSYAGRVFFAGEQASPGYFGLMEGALQAGGRAARRIVELICPAALPRPR